MNLSLPLPFAHLFLSLCAAAKKQLSRLRAEITQTKASKFQDLMRAEKASRESKNLSSELHKFQKSMLAPPTPSVEGGGGGAELESLMATNEELRGKISLFETNFSTLRHNERSLNKKLNKYKNTISELKQTIRTLSKSMEASAKSHITSPGMDSEAYGGMDERGFTPKEQIKSLHGDIKIQKTNLYKIREEMIGFISVLRDQMSAIKTSCIFWTDRIDLENDKNLEVFKRKIKGKIAQKARVSSRSQELPIAMEKLIPAQMESSLERPPPPKQMTRTARRQSKIGNIKFYLFALLHINFQKKTKKKYRNVS